MRGNLTIGDHVCIRAHDKANMDARWDHGYVVSRIRGPVITVIGPWNSRCTITWEHVRLVNPAADWDELNPRITAQQQRWAKAGLHEAGEAGYDVPQEDYFTSRCKRTASLSNRDYRPTRRIPVNPDMAQYNTRGRKRLQEIDNDPGIADKRIMRQRLRAHKHFRAHDNGKEECLSERHRADEAVQPICSHCGTARTHASWHDSICYCLLLLRIYHEGLAAPDGCHGTLQLSLFWEWSPNGYSTDSASKRHGALIIFITPTRIFGGIFTTIINHLMASCMTITMHFLQCFVSNAYVDIISIFISSGLFV